MLLLPFLGEMSGSLGGLTASHNRGGRYLRARSIPTNPDTNGQQSARATFAGLASFWKVGLSPANRALWEAYAANTPYQNALGETKYLTGMNWFVGCNSVITRVPAAVTQQSAPTSNGRAIPADPVFDETGVLDIDSIASFAGAKAVQVQWAGPFGSGIQFFKGPFPSVNTTWSTYAGITFPLSLVASPTVGDVYFTRLVQADALGRTSPSVITRHVIL